MQSFDGKKMKFELIGEFIGIVIFCLQSMSDSGYRFGYEKAWVVVICFDCGIGTKNPNNHPLLLCTGAKICEKCLAEHKAHDKAVYEHYMESIKK